MLTHSCTHAHSPCSMPHCYLHLSLVPQAIHGAIAAHLLKYGLKVAALTLEEQAPDLEVPQGRPDPGGLLWAWYCAGGCAAQLSTA